MTSRISMVKSEGFSLTMKNKSAEIKYLGVFTYPIATCLTFKKWGLPKAKIACPLSRSLTNLCHCSFR